MSEYPILLFPKPDKVSRTKLSSGFGKFNIPSHSRQQTRLNPLFEQLQKTFEARCAELQSSAVGTEPEQVLVIEIVGSIEDFANAVKKIEGFEWLCEFEIDEIDPDDDFNNTKDKEKGLQGRLYLIMTNQTALNQLLSLWQKYNDDEKFKFEHGLGKFRHLFKHLKNIRRWDVEDRLNETGIIEAWQEDLKHEGHESVRCEIELWYSNSDHKRAANQKNIKYIISALEGTILSSCVINEIAYHAILAELPRREVETILKTRTTNLVKCDGIMFFRPTGQMSTGEKHEGEGETDNLATYNIPTIEEKPTVAILDGLPLSNHELLQGRLIIDDPDDWSSTYETKNRKHCTAMSSLIIYGDLSNTSPIPLKRPIYVRPIMKPDNSDFNDSKQEIMPSNILSVDLIHQAVRRIFEEGKGNIGVAPTIKIINLSVADKHRHFNNIMSPLAKLIDWLSHKYSIIFVISAGNHIEGIELDIALDKFKQLKKQEQENLIVKNLFRDIRNRRILSPAESVNGITVGALHDDESASKDIPSVINPFASILPSPISPFGKGYRKSIKPDIILPGGKQLYLEGLPGTHAINIARSLKNTGNKVAYTGNQMNKSTAYLCGTSNSAALASRSSAICYEYLIELMNEHPEISEYSNYTAPLIKAMLIHGASWNSIGEKIKKIIQNDVPKGKTTSATRRWLGYGVPDIHKVANCMPQRATLLGFGELKDEEAHIYNLPLPPSLISKTDWRKLTATLAWLSPVSVNTQRYRNASLWFELLGTSLSLNRKNGDWEAVRRGTVQHEIFEGNKAIPFSDGDNIQIKVNCKKDAGKILEPVPYGLVISLEVAEGIETQLYEEIQTRIEQKIKIEQLLS